MKRILFFFLISFLFSSCVWIPQLGSSSLKEKTTIQSFNDVNDPFVFELKAYERFNLMGSSEDKGNSNHCIGELFVVYDWENESIIDNLYVPDVNRNIGVSETLNSMKASDGSLNFYSYSYNGNRLYKLNSKNCGTDGIQRISLTDFNDIYTNGIVNSVYSDAPNILYFYRTGYDFEKSCTLGEIRIITAGSDVISEPIPFETYSDLNSRFCRIIPDYAGDYWLSYEVKENERYRLSSVIRKINVRENKLEEPLLIFDNHEGAVYDEMDGWNKVSHTYVLYGNADGLIVARDFYKKYRLENQKLYYIDIATKSISEFTASDEMTLTNLVNYSDCIATVNGKTYLVSYDIKGEYPDNRYEWSVYEIDISGKQLSKVVTFNNPDLRGFSSLKVRENRIYIFYEIDSDVVFTSFDTVSNSFSDVKTISVNDFIK